MSEATVGVAHPVPSHWGAVQHFGMISSRNCPHSPLAVHRLWPPAGVDTNYRVASRPHTFSSCQSGGLTSASGVQPCRVGCGQGPGRPKEEFSRPSASIPSRDNAELSKEVTQKAGAPGSKLWVAENQALATVDLVTGQSLQSLPGPCQWHRAVGEDIRATWLLEAAADSGVGSYALRIH